MTPLDRAMLVAALSTLVAIGRLAIPGHGLSFPGTYEAFAHIWVGALIVLSLNAENRPAAPIALTAITVLETVMFLLK